MFILKFPELRLRLSLTEELPTQTILAAAPTTELSLAGLTENNYGQTLLELNIAFVISPQSRIHPEI